MSLLTGRLAGRLRISQCLPKAEDIPVLAHAQPLQLLESHLCRDVEMSVVPVEIYRTVAKVPRLHFLGLHTQATCMFPRHAAQPTGMKFLDSMKDVSIT